MLEHLGQPLRQPVGFECPTHAARGTVGHGLRGADITGLRRSGRNVGQDLLAALGADLDEELMALGIDELGEREIEPGLGAGPGVHRHAKARTARLATLHRDDERAVTTRPVVGIAVRTAEKHPILDVDRRDLARTHAKERVTRRGPVVRVRRDEAAVGVEPRTEQHRLRPEQVLLPRVRADRVSEQRAHRRASTGGTNRHPARR